MRISVFGLGYVGCVSGACFADMGHTVIGVDVNQTKVDMINTGRAPVIEAGLSDFVARVVSTGRFSATSDWQNAILGTDVAFVCVGTPSNGNGSLCLDVARRVAEQIGCALRLKADYFVVAVRSHGASRNG